VIHELNVGDDIPSVCDQKISIRVGNIINGYGGIVFYNFYKRVLSAAQNS
jgi:hypothetical protein